MRFLNTKKIIFWIINVIIASLLLLSIGWIVLKGLNRYTRHGYFIPVPDLRGITPAEALELAEEKELLTEVIDSIYDNDAKPGTIVEQFPSAGSKVKNNRVIQLTVNASSPELVIFPNFRNSPFRQTLQRLINLGFKPGQVIYAPSDFKNLVLDLQLNGVSVQPNSKIPKGETIDLILGDGNTVNEMGVPNLTGKTLDEVRRLLLYSYLNLGEVIFDNTVTDEADRATAFIFMQRPSPYPGNKIELGGTISVFLTKDPNKKIVTDTIWTEEYEEYEEAEEIIGTEDYD